MAANQTDITSIESRVSSIEGSDITQNAQIQALQSELAALEARVAAIETLPGIAHRLARHCGLGFELVLLLPLLMWLRSRGRRRAVHNSTDSASSWPC